MQRVAFGVILRQRDMITVEQTHNGRRILLAASFIPAPNTAGVELRYSALGQIIENTFHVRSSSPFTLANLVTLRGVFDAWDSATWKLYRSPNVTLLGIRSRGLDAGDSPIDEYVLATPRAGTYGGTLLPLNVTVAIKLLSSSAGRSARGRIFFPGITTSALSGNQVLSGWADPAKNAVVTLKSNIVAANSAWAMCITSRRHDNAWRATAVNYDVTSVALSDYNVDSQRRRLTGRGRT